MGARPVLGIFLLVILLAILLVIGAAGRVTAAEVPVLLADVNQEPETPSSGSISEPVDFFQVGDRLLFSTRGDDEDEGILWSTDGTAEGTHMVSSALCPASCNAIKPLAVWRGLGIVMTASGDSRVGYPSIFRLWRTDGTKAGTFPLPVVLTEYPEIFSSPESEVFYFSGYRRGTGGLWRSDGTRAGTSVVQDARGTIFYGPRNLTFWRGRLYFMADIGEETSLWSTDGTPEGTSFIALANGDSERGPVLQTTSSRLFFSSGDAAEDLWVTDGTPEGTRRLLELEPSACYAQPYRCDPSDLESMFAVEDKVYFITHRKNHGSELWRSDGTESGTRPLIEMTTGFDFGLPVRLDGRWLLPVSAAPGEPATLWTADDGFTRLEPLSGCAGGTCPQSFAFLQRTDSGAWLFAGQDVAHGDEVWITDGTAAGTRLLADICPGPCDGYRRYDSFSRVFGSTAGKTYFAAFSNPELDTSYELWVTDGTPAGTHRVTGYVSDLGFLGDLAVFGTGGERSTIWSTDGTAAGTRRVTDLRTLAPGSNPSFHPLRNGVVFLADEGDREALWKSDGRPEGTSRFFDFPPNRNVYDDPWTRAGGLYFFQAESTDEDPRRIDLWRTDGTAQGTGRLATFPLDVWYIELTVAWNGKLLFQTQSSLKGCSFWSSDGTAAGTREILRPEQGRRCPTAVTPLGSRFVFVARVKGPDGLIPQIFVSDGTPEGTRQISQIRSHREAFEFDKPVAVGGVAFFRIHAAGRLYGDDWEVWRTDGTPEGTYRISQASKWSQPNDLYGFRGSLYLSASIGTSYVVGYFRIPVRGGEPVLLARTGYDAVAGRYTPLESFAPLGHRLLFMPYDDTHGYELWVTDGTPAGTRLLRDIRTGPISSRPSGFIQAGDRVFFTAEDGEHGRELWASDGTPEGTRLVWDLNPGGFSSLPDLFTVSGGHLFFSADDGETGVEPWSLLIPSPSPAQPPLPAPSPGSGRD